jgi:hypothetical protein
MSTDRDPFASASFARSDDLAARQDRYEPTTSWAALTPPAGVRA